MMPAETEPANTLHAISPDDASWSSINLAEAVPGVLTPLCASAWIPASEMGLRAPFHAMGVLESKRLSIPEDPAERITNAFYGRMAVRVDFLCEIGDLVPGQSGEALSRDFFGFVPPGFVSKPSNRRIPMILARYPRTLLRIAKQVERQRAETDIWWRKEIPRTSGLSIEESQVRLAEAITRFGRSLALQAVISACAVQPVHEQLNTIASAAGIDGSVLLRGHGSHEESVVLDDLWAVSRGTLPFGTFLERHGYHGSGEGEVSNRVWREDPAPVERIVKQYAAMADDEAPTASDDVHTRERRHAESMLFASTGGPGRLKAKLILKLARRFIPLRGVGKVAYLQNLDVIRATARRLGGLLVARGLLIDADDAFFLTDAELTGDLSGDLKSLVAERRALRIRYQGLDVSTAWTGQPTATPIGDPADDAGVTTLTGIGASHGTVEGRAVIVLDPSDVEIEAGDILIAHTTDPSWVSVMFLAEALVVDIGGLMSHAAVVARELDIPCVMNTGTGTQTLRTGDTIRVDGAAGTIEIIHRAEGITA